MSRGTSLRTWRCLAVWLAATAGLLAAGVAATPSLGGLRATAAWTRPFEDVLIDLAAVLLLVAVARLWLITTVTVAEVARTGGVRRPGGATRRLVLAACGAAVVVGTTVPAHADGLSGLPLPDRAEGVRTTAVRNTPAPAERAAQSPTADTVRVRAGDSLWSIAVATLPPGAAAAQVDARWRAIWAANAAAVGPDPDLIRPGLRLRLPDTHD